MARTDLAAPSVIDPAAFTFVAGVYFGSNPSEDFDAVLGEWLGEKDDKAGWYSKRPKVLADFPPLDPAGNFVRKGTCDHCGARFDWGAVYAHTNGGHIVVGNVCADNTLAVPTRHDLEVNRLKKRLAAQRLAARKAAAARTEAEAGGFAWLYSGKHDNKTLDDIAHKGLQFGGLTPRQIELVKRIHDGTPAEWEVKRAARQAERAAAEAAAQPVPQVDGRIEFEGTVLTMKEQDGYMPGSTCIKVLVQHATGYKLWGTLPSALDEVKRGDVVAFSVRVERSPNDDKFGFFSRPTKPRLVKAAEASA